MEFILETLWIVLFFVVMYVYVTGRRWWAMGFLEEKPFKCAGGGGDDGDQRFVDYETLCFAIYFQHKLSTQAPDAEYIRGCFF